MTMSRAQILLTQNQHQQLRELAKRENRSISDVTRNLLNMALQQRRQSVAAKMECVHRASRMANRILRERDGAVIEINVVSLVNDAREERVHDLGSY